MKTAEKLSALRANLKNLEVEGFIVPRTDEYQNEFVPECFERLAWLTGFTGSAGFAVILPEIAGVLSDGRYTIQLKNQVDQTLYEVGDSIKVTLSDYLAHEAKSGQVIGYDAKLHSPKQIQMLEAKLKEKSITLKALEPNPIDEVWADRPPEPLAKVEIFPEKYAGRSSAEKRMAIAQFIKDQGAKACVITLPDSIAWLLNIRGSDVSHNPVALSYALLHDDGRAEWFIATEKVSGDVLRHAGNTVEVFEPTKIEERLAMLAGDDRPVMIDPQRSSKYFFDVLKKNKIIIREEKDPCILPKAVKTTAEQEAMIAAHVRDGAAVTKFLYWLSNNVQGKTEVEIADQLETFRKADPMHRDSSFDTICGWASNGAIVHYRAEDKSAATVTGNGLLLIDSGAQYADGTTDITRTIAIGTPTDEMKDRYTRVLKGHIALASTRFPQGTTGAQLDSLARQALWQAGLDYAHGTGHGVGCYLSVHEEAAGISPRGTEAVLPGMIISNEPGYYKEGEYGIRIENLILCNKTGDKTEDGRDMLYFETLTLAPIDLSVVDLRLLTDSERWWINDYHFRVRDVLSPTLEPAEKSWLDQVTKFI